MTANAPRSRPERSGPESGHLLLIVMIGLTVMAILLTALVQQWSVVQRRENEQELIFRGNQYVKAIKLYQMEHGGALPTSLEVLVKPGPRRLRYIRKLFRDPMAPDGKWGILLADPSGRGYINPNAPPPDQQAVEGLEDLGQGLRTGLSPFDAKIKASNMRNNNKQKAFAAMSSYTGLQISDAAGDPEVKESVTAPGQPVGPIAGVVSLYDETSFKLYREKENYTEWAFNIFDDANKQGQNPQAVTPVPTPGSGIGPQGGFSILGGSNGPIGGNQGPTPFGTPGSFGAPPTNRNKNPNPPNGPRH